MADTEQIVQFKADASDLVDGISQVTDKFSELGDLVTDLRESASDLWDVFVIGEAIDKVHEFVSSIIELGLSMREAADETGMSLQQLSGVKLVAAETGVSFERVTMAVSRFNENLQNLNTGSSRVREGLQALGITQADITKYSNDSAGMLQLVADRLAQYGDGANKAAIITSIFGQRLGAELGPFLEDVANNGLQNAIDKSDELGDFLGPEFVGKTEAAQKSIADFKASLQGLETELADKLLPSFTAWVKELGEGIALIGASKLQKLSLEITQTEQAIKELQAKMAEPVPTTGFSGFVDKLIDSSGVLDKRMAMFQQRLKNLKQQFKEQQELLKGEPAEVAKKQAPAEQDTSAITQAASQQEATFNALAAYQVEVAKAAGDQIIHDKQATSAAIEAAITKETAAYVEAENKRYNAVVATLAKERAAVGKDSQEGKAIEAKEEEAALQHQTKLTEITAQRMRAQEQAKAKFDEEQEQQSQDAKKQLDVQLNNIKESFAARTAVYESSKAYAQLTEKQKTAYIQEQLREQAVEEANAINLYEAKLTAQKAFIANVNDPAYKEDVKLFNAAEQQKLQIALQTDEKLVNANKNAVNQQKSDIEQFAADAASSMTTLFNSVLEGQKTWTQAAKTMVDQFAMDFIDDVVRMVTELLVLEAAEAVTGLFGGAGIAGGQAGIMSDVKGAGGLLGKILGAKQEGGAINATGLYQLHAGEYVLPPRVMSQLKSGGSISGASLSGGGGGGLATGAGPAAVGNSMTVINNVSAVDGQSVARLFRSNSDSLVSTLQSANRNFAMIPKRPQS